MADEEEEEDPVLTAMLHRFQATFQANAQGVSDERSYIARCVGLARLPSPWREWLDEPWRVLAHMYGSTELNAQEEVLCQLMINYVVEVFQVIRERNAQ